MSLLNNCFVFTLAPSVADVQAAIEHIFPLVYEFRKERTPEDLSLLQAAKKRRLSAAGMEEVYNIPSKTTNQQQQEEEEEEDSECETEETW